MTEGLLQADPRWAFFLDIDGTLLEIADTPSSVLVDHHILNTISRVHRSTGGALALISGRGIEDIDGLFPKLSLALAGQHGMERRDARGGLHHHLPEGVDWPWLKALIKGTFNSRGLLIEDKGLTLAVHFRLNPAEEARVYQNLRQIVADAGAAVTLQPGKCVMEVKPAGRDKGTAIADFMAEAPFRGRRPVFLGDDLTDEYGFRMVNDIGGISIKVGDGDTAAQWRLADVSAVRAWLDDLRDLPAAKDEKGQA